MSKLKLQSTPTAVMLMKLSDTYAENARKLEGALNKYDSLLDQIPDKLSEVMMPMKQDILTVFEPGYRSLNWLSSNLDAYIDDAFEKT